MVCVGYGQVTALALDPVEKKSLSRFRPGRSVLSVGNWGCNLCCPFCQNAVIAAAGEEIAAGFLPPEELAEGRRPWPGAANIDLKGFTQGWYERLGGDLETVKANIARTAASPCHLVVTTLIVPGVNDGEGEMEALSAWLAALDPDIPLHVSRFFPRHRMADRPPMPVEAVYRLAETARKRLNYVYTGNC